MSFNLNDIIHKPVLIEIIYRLCPVDAGLRDQPAFVACQGRHTTPTDGGIMYQSLDEAVMMISLAEAYDLVCHSGVFPTPLIARRPRLRPGGLRADLNAAHEVNTSDRAAARADLHHLDDGR